MEWKASRQGAKNAEICTTPEENTTPRPSAPRAPRLSETLFAQHR